MAEFQEAIGGGMPVLPIEIMALRASAQQAKVLAVDLSGPLKPLLRVLVGQAFSLAQTGQGMSALLPHQ